MTSSLEADVLLRILDRLPSLPWSSRIDPSTMTSTLVYVSPGLVELCGLSEAEMRADPHALTKRLEPDDAARLLAQVASSAQTLLPTSWTGRVNRPSGEQRWIEMQVAYERDVDGTILTYGQVFDVTERKRSEQLHSKVIDALPAGVIVMAPDGDFPIYNPAAGRFGPHTPGVHPRDRLPTVRVFKGDGVTPFPREETLLRRALGGEATPETDLVIRSDAFEGAICLQAIGVPIRDEGGQILAGMMIFHDITALRTTERELRQRNAELLASEEAKTALIERQSHFMNELEDPVLELWDGVLVMPIIGLVDERRAGAMAQYLLAEVARTQASFVIIDLTGVEAIDSALATRVLRLVRKVELIGARCVLTGVRATVSEALVDIGVDLDHVTTLRNLKHGLREALRFARLERQ